MGRDMMDGRDIRQRGRWLAVATTLVFATFAGVLVLEAVSVAQSGEPQTGWLYTLTYRAPVLLYLLALWMARRSFAAVAAGRSFDSVLPYLLTSVGSLILAGALVSVLVQPILLRWIAEGAWRLQFNFDPAAITLGVVGMMLILVSQLLMQSVAMREELDSIL